MSKSHFKLKIFMPNHPLLIIFFCSLFYLNKQHHQVYSNQDKIFKDKPDFSMPPPLNSLPSRTNICLESVHFIFTAVVITTTLNEAAGMSSLEKSSVVLNGLPDSTCEPLPSKLHVAARMIFKK